MSAELRYLLALIDERLATLQEDAHG